LKGFKLPVTETSTAADAKGMYIYNTNPIVGEGVYVWDGYQWILVKASLGELPADTISISSPTGRSSVVVGSYIELNVDLKPVNTTDNKITWSSENINGWITVSQTGRVTGLYPGVTYATATLPSGLSTSMQIYVLPPELQIDTVRIGSRDYGTYNFNGDVWMIENSMEGTADAEYFGTDPELVNGYYYSRDRALNPIHPDSPCPGDWHVPTQDEASRLIAYVNQNPYLLGLWKGFENSAGQRHTSVWERWGLAGGWIVSDWGAPDTNRRIIRSERQFGWYPNWTSGWASVRCVKN
jgi:hypothetical protein